MDANEIMESIRSLKETINNELIPLAGIVTLILFIYFREEIGKGLWKLIKNL